MKKILVPWSGGMDSTYLIYYLLECGCSVDAFYTKILNNKSKSKRELNSIKHIKKEFDKYQNFKFNSIINQYDINNVGNLYFKQFPLFLHDILHNVKNYHNEVNIGYVGGDDAISYLHDFIKSYNSFSYMFNFKLPRLNFPLSKSCKSQNYYNLPSKLLKHITWCESEVQDFCGKCLPCKKMKMYGLYDKHLNEYHSNIVREDICVPYYGGEYDE